MHAGQAEEAEGLQAHQVGQGGQSDPQREPQEVPESSMLAVSGSSRGLVQVQGLELPA